MGAGRPLAQLILTVEENNRLVEWARRRKTAQALALRARIVMACAEGATNTEVSQRLRVTLQTVGKWRQRFVDQRLDGLLDAPRPGQPRKITDAKVEEVLAMTLERRPKEATHWSTRLMAKATGLNQSAILRIWHAFGLQPHRSETLWACICRRPRAQWCCVLTRSRKFKHSTARSRYCRCRLAWQSGALMIMCATARPRCSRRWTSPRARSSENSIGVIAVASS